MNEDLLSKNEFAKRCGVKTAYINQYIKRNKISVLSPDGETDMVNLTTPKTKSFAKKRGYDIEQQYSQNLDPEVENKVLSKTKSKAASKKPEPAQPAAHIPINQRPEEQPEGQMPAPKGITLEHFLVLSSSDDVDTVKKKIEIQKLVEQAEIEKIKKEKLQGLSIPTDLVHDIYNRSFAGIAIAFYEGAADLVLRMRHRYGASVKDGIELKTELEEIINLSIQRMKDTSESELASVISQNKESRSRGEKK